MLQVTELGGLPRASTAFASGIGANPLTTPSMLSRAGWESGVMLMGQVEQVRHSHAHVGMNTLWVVSEPIQGLRNVKILSWVVEYVFRKWTPQRIGLIQTFGSTLSISHFPHPTQIRCSVNPNSSHVHHFSLMFTQPGLFQLYVFDVLAVAAAAPFLREGEHDSENLPVPHSSAEEDLNEDWTSAKSVYFNCQNIHVLCSI